MAPNPSNVHARIALARSGPFVLRAPRTGGGVRGTGRRWGVLYLVIPSDYRRGFVIPTVSRGGGLIARLPP
jgi:hypothetical protein